MGLNTLPSSPTFHFSSEHLNDLHPTKSNGHFPSPSFLSCLFLPIADNSIGSLQFRRSLWEAFIERTSAQFLLLPIWRPPCHCTKLTFWMLISISNCFPEDVLCDPGLTSFFRSQLNALSDDSTFLFVLSHIYSNLSPTEMFSHSNLLFLFIILVTLCYYLFTFLIYYLFLCLLRNREGAMFVLFSSVSVTST